MNIFIKIQQEEAKFMNNIDKINRIYEVFGVDTGSYVSKYFGKDYGKIMRTGKIDPSTYSILKTLKFAQDKRSPLEFAQHMLINWVMECMGDKILWAMFDKVKRNGTDSNFRFSKAGKITTDADFIVEKNGEEIYVEMITDFGGYWNKKHVGDLRGNKLLNLMEKSKTMKVYILAIDMKYETYGLIEITPSTCGTKTWNENWRKWVYQIEIDTTKFKRIEKTIFQKIA